MPQNREKRATMPATSSKAKTYSSVLHKNCGGDIILVAASKYDAALVCRKCKTFWNTSTDYIPLPQVLVVGEDMYINGQED